MNSWALTDLICFYLLGIDCVGSYFNSITAVLTIHGCGRSWNSNSSWYFVAVIQAYDDDIGYSVNNKITEKCSKVSFNVYEDRDGSVYWEIESRIRENQRTLKCLRCTNNQIWVES